jgi:putative transposase
MPDAASDSLCVVAISDFSVPCRSDVVHTIANHCETVRRRRDRRGQGAGKWGSVERGRPVGRGHNSFRRPAGSRILAAHAFNRGVARLPLFEKDADYEAFERAIDYAQAHDPTRILAYCVMPNHWHFVLWPREDGELSAFLRRLAHTHTQRWHAHHHTAGTGHLYQGRFKSFPVKRDEHLLSVARYVERNALRANLVGRAQDWRWCSLWRRLHGDEESRALLYEPWPVERPADWVRRVNRPQTEEEVAALRESLRRGRPFGDEPWQRRTALRHGLEYTLRPPHRPRKAPPK